MDKKKNLKNNISETLSEYINALNSGSVPKVREFFSELHLNMDELETVLGTIELIKERSHILAYTTQEKELIFNKIRNNFVTSPPLELSKYQRPDFLLFLLNITNEIWGITKITKLLFLVGREAIGENKKFDFYHHYAYDFGPFDKTIRQDIEALKRIGFIQEELPPVNKNQTVKNVDAIYRLSDLGKKFSNQLMDEFKKENSVLIEKITLTVGKYSGMKLDSLMEYVYKNYPETTKKSKIKKQVLGYE